MNILNCLRNHFIFYNLSEEEMYNLNNLAKTSSAKWFMQKWTLDM